MYGFDVMAMVRALRQIDEKENAKKAADSNPTCRDFTPPAEHETRHGQP
jgi:hypothetical protein